MSDEIRFLGDMERLEIRPGDRFVLTTPFPISADGAARIKAVWAEFAGDDVPLLILDPSMKLGAIGSKDETAPS